MAKWDFKIVGASFVKELAPVADDVQFRSQSFMQPSFDLEGDKIVMKESGQYKTAISFSQIGEIDGVAPTDLEDAYAKLLVLVENFNGGGGAPGTTPNLTQVLTVGDKEFQQIDVDRDFELADRLKYSLIGGGMTMTLDDDLDLFPTNSLIQFFVSDNSDINATATLNFGAGTACYYLIENITTLTLNVGDFCELKKAGAGSVWVLNVWNKSTGGGGVPYTGATQDVDLGEFDLYTQEVWLYDGPNDNYGSLHYTDGNFHIEDSDGHPLFVIEDGFLQLHLSATIQSNLILSNLTAIRDHYLPDVSGTISLNTTATTGAVISFANPQVYNSIASPSSSNITDNLTGARIGVVQKIYHNAGTAPTFPAGWVRRGTGTYVTSTLNIIYAEWSVGTTVEYWITQ
jgi:hypothetical protein